MANAHFSMNGVLPARHCRVCMCIYMCAYTVRLCDIATRDLKHPVNPGSPAAHRCWVDASTFASQQAAWRSRQRLGGVWLGSFGGRQPIAWALCFRKLWISNFYLEVLIGKRFADRRLTALSCCAIGVRCRIFTCWQPDRLPSRFPESKGRLKECTFGFGSALFPERR